MGGCQSAKVKACESVSHKLLNLRQVWIAHGQGHVFDSFEKQLLSLSERQTLLHHVQRVDVTRIAALFNSVRDLKCKADVITPFERTTIKSAVSSERAYAWRRNGLSEIAAGRVAVVMMAGGQGTRLGSSLPKGCFNIGLASGKSLFQLYAERLLKIKQLAEEACAAADRKLHAPAPLLPSVPWYIMTSEHTRQLTIEFFEANGYFGLPKEEVFFFNQGLLPALTRDGKIIMETSCKIALSPNGNGGVYSALKSSGMLADMAQRGIEHVHLFGVDNVLVRVADPSLIGFALIEGSDCVNTVIARVDPKEKVGVMCCRNGNPSVVEYSELTDDLFQTEEGKERKVVLHPPSTASAGLEVGAKRSVADGVMNLANIANHYFTIGFLSQMADQELPLHPAWKKIGSLDGEGKTCLVDGLKMEMFVFDAFAFSSKMAAFLVSREQEFSPVKNATGLDSPATACRDVYALHSSWRGFSSDADISPLISYEGEGLQHE